MQSVKVEFSLTRRWLEFEASETSQLLFINDKHKMEFATGLPDKLKIVQPKFDPNWQN
jgi:hypothetical protein